jgi:hypothetical protein
VSAKVSCTVLRGGERGNSRTLPDYPLSTLPAKGIAQVTGTSPKTVKDWGRDFRYRPKYVTRILRQADLLNQFQQLVAQGIINLPLDSPQE